jgi:hypothetical protein
MQLTTFTEVKKTAHAKWREYRDAEKAVNGKEPIYTDLKKMYWQIKHGKILIDIKDVVRAAGVHANQHPKLAICRADSKKVTCDYWQVGRVKFVGDTVRSFDTKHIIDIESCLPTYQFSDKNIFRRLDAIGACSFNSTQAQAKAAYRFTLYTLGSR